MDDSVRWEVWFLNLTLCLHSLIDFHAVLDFLDDEMGFQATCQFYKFIARCRYNIRWMRKFYEKFRKANHRLCSNNFHHLFWKQKKIPPKLCWYVTVQVYRPQNLSTSHSLTTLHLIKPARILPFQDFDSAYIALHNSIKM